MEFTEYIRKPFVVSAAEITVDNIEEVAELIGTLHRKEDGTPYIVPNRRLIPNVFRVYPGFWMTKFNGNINCYNPKAFSAQFTPSTPEVNQWVEHLNTTVDTGFPLPQSEAPTSVIE